MRHPENNKQITVVVDGEVRVLTVESVFQDGRRINFEDDVASFDKLALLGPQPMVFTRALQVPLNLECLRNRPKPQE